MPSKWSDSSKEGKLLKRIVNRLDKYEKKMKEPETYDDMEELLKFARSVAFVAEKKSNIAKHADWEKRIKVLESKASLAQPMITK